MNDCELLVNTKKCHGFVKRNFHNFNVIKSPKFLSLIIL